MTLTLHTIAPAKGARSKKFRVGRGNSSGRGTTAGRGTKGQRARTGGRKRLKLKGMKQMLLSFPKKRGFQSKFVEVFSVRVGRVSAAFAAGDQVDIKALKSKGMIPKRAVAAKLIGGGAVDKKLIIKGVLASAPVKEAIIKAGGSFEAIEKQIKGKR
jgi:large subunit ribosomal protein L15